MILEQAITAKASTSTSTSTSSKSEVLSFEQAELLLFVWKTGLLPGTQASVLKQLLSLLIKPVEPDNIATSCIAMTHVAFLAQTLLRPELVPINELLADVQKNMHFTTESKDDKPKPDDEKTMLPNVVKTMTKTMGCCYMWKLFSVSVEDAPSLEHDDEGWHQSMFEALGLVGVLLKVDPILATCHMDALTSLLWVVRPPESLWEQLEDPALLLTFGVHEATTHLLAWLAYVCFHTDNTRMPE